MFYVVLFLSNIEIFYILFVCILLTILCLENDTGVAHYNFNTLQPILVIFRRDVAETVVLSKNDLLSHLS